MRIEELQTYLKWEGDDITACSGKSLVADRVNSSATNLYIQETQPTLVSGQPFVWYELDESGVIQDIHIFDGVI